MCKKIITLFFLLIFSFSFSQWNPAVLHTEKIRPEVQTKRFYTLNLGEIKSKLKNASETGKNARAAEISVPVLEGKTERFAVYSAPVVVPELAEKYGLGSYVGVGIDDPQKYIRFSLSGNDFQSMIVKNGEYQFIEPQDKAKTVYGVFPKTNKNTSGKPFVCGTDESIFSKNQIDQLFANSQIAHYNATNFAKASDRKYRTLRLAVSVTGEYTQYFGGVTQALTQINATLTRVNGILEKDLATHLILQNFTNIIYTDPATDPYSDSNVGVNGIWGTELMNTLSNPQIVGDNGFDIGILFGATGGGGNARCIGCICSNDKTLSSGLPTNYKGSAYVSPADGKPYGDTFDIDYVIHEIGHQLGANHTFSHALEGFGASVEPGLGSTIMGYAGTQTFASVQPHSDPYFHGFSIAQIQNNLLVKTCDTETAITTNNPPSIIPFSEVTIPRGTAFVLAGTATDSENDAMTYTWEQIDNATSPITSITGNNTTGAIVRSLRPTTNSTRYIPQLSSVMEGKLTDPAIWESVSNVARNTNFRFTVRDNFPDPTKQQVSFDDRKIIVGSNGPFKLNVDAGQNFFAGISNTLSWDVVGTDQFPYNAANVKISYTTDSGVTWNTISETTPNDGNEIIVIPNSLLGQSTLQFRIEAIGNIFYAVSPKVNVVSTTSCVVTVPYNIKVSQITHASATVSWEAIPSIASYILEYRKKGDTSFTTITTSSTTVTINGLEEGTVYEYRIKSTCPTSESAYSAIAEFTTVFPKNCNSSSSDGTNEFIQKVEIERFVHASGSSEYSDFRYETILLNVNIGSYSIRITPKWNADKTPVSIAAWIDFNNDEIFSASEQILAVSGTTEQNVYASFNIPADVYTGASGVKMRVSLKVGNELPEPCESFSFGEVEDYTVVFETKSVFYQNEVIAYPNPFTDTINLTNVENGTEFKLYDMSGRLLKIGKVVLNKLDLYYLKPGVYLLAVEGEKAIKIIKKD